MLYDTFAQPRDARRLPARLLHRGHGRRAVRAARRRRAPARRRRCASGEEPRDARARRRRPRPALRRGAAVAEARGPASAARRASRAPTSCSSTTSPCCTSSAAGAACSRSPTPAPRGAARGRPDPVEVALAALADAVRAGRVPKLALERIDGEPAIASTLVGALVELGFQAGPAAAHAQRLSARARSDFATPEHRCLRGSAASALRVVCRTIGCDGDTSGSVRTSRVR